jgi:hypothetical protein
MNNDNDIENFLYRILCGYTCFEYNDEQYILKSPNSDIRYRATILYNKIISEEKYHNWIREENIEATMISSGVWGRNTEDVIKGLYKRLDDLKIQLYKSWIMPSQQKPIRKNIEHIKRELNKILSIKNNFYNHTLEGYASSIKNEYIICQTLYKNTKLVFDFNNISSSKSYLDFNNISQEIEALTVNISDIKKLARSPSWKSYWTANKNHSVFSGPVSEWSEEQRLLYKLSQMYDNIYEHPECPEDIVIEDDDMLDGWLLLQQRERVKAKKQKSLELNNKKIKDSNEVFLFPKSQEEFADVMALNSDEARLDIQEKMRFIEAKGSAEDSELPDVKRNIQLQLNALNKR